MKKMNEGKWIKEIIAIWVSLSFLIFLVMPVSFAADLAPTDPTQQLAPVVSATIDAAPPTAPVATASTSTDFMSGNQPLSSTGSGVETEAENDAQVKKAVTSLPGTDIPATTTKTQTANGTVEASEFEKSIASVAEDERSAEAGSGGTTTTTAATLTTSLIPTHGQWTTSTVTWGIDYSSVDQYLQTSATTTEQETTGFWEATKQAFTQWAGYIPLTFQEAVSSAAQIVIRVLSGAAFDVKYGATNNYVAYAYYPTNGDVYLDGNRIWGLPAVIAGGVSYGATAGIGLVATLIHEFGHSLGLDHTTDATSVMYPTISSSKTTIADTDIAVPSVQSLYGVGKGSVQTLASDPPPNSAPVVQNFTAPATNLNTPQKITLPQATDANNDPVTYSVTQPQHGTLMRDPDFPNDPTKYIYTPAQDYYGADSFTYTAYDGKDYSNIATVSLTVLQFNQPPWVGSVTTTTTDVDPLKAGHQAYAGSTVTYTATATDENANTLTWKWYYIVNGVTYLASSGTGATATVSYSYSGTSAGKVYTWYVVYSDGTTSVASSTFTEEIVSKPKRRK